VLISYNNSVSAEFYAPAFSHGEIEIALTSAADRCHEKSDSQKASQFPTVALPTPAELYNTLVEHRVRYFHEPGDVRANYEVAGCPYSSAVSHAFLWIVNMMWRKRESTSSRGHGKRIEVLAHFQTGCRHATSFAALPGRIEFFSRGKDRRPPGQSHVGRLGNQIATVLNPISIALHR